MGEGREEREFALRVARAVARHAWTSPLEVARVSKRIAGRGAHYAVRLARWWGVRLPGERAA